mgnify:CR=1 FL=1
MTRIVEFHSAVSHIKLGWLAKIRISHKKSIDEENIEIFKLLDGGIVVVVVCAEKKMKYTKSDFKIQQF